jgi:hypothetical protein
VLTTKPIDGTLLVDADVVEALAMLETVIGAEEIRSN